jgi:regulator of nonsense transcripts 2
LRLEFSRFFSPQTTPQVTEEVLDQEEDGLDDMDDPPSVETDVAEEETAAAPTTPVHSATPDRPPVQDKKYFDNFLANLQDCVNRELIDSAAVDFLMNSNTKNNRKKLVKSLFNVQRTRLDLFPLYSRFVANINLASPDVAIDLCQMLKIDFKYHVKKRDQINIESKIKTMRFIGELTKFGLYAKLEALYCLKVLLNNFQHHHIEMACAFLEVCGQYLYNSKESRVRISVYVEQMMRLKTANALDSRHAIQIENCYYLVKPPEGAGKLQQKVRPPIHLYIRHLVFEELNKTNVDKMIKLMRRINWDDKGVGAYAIKCLSKAYNIRYHSIRYLADLVSGLSSYQEKAVVKVIDTVFEDIRAGLEIHSPKLAQRRVAMVKYLGELYNYRLVDSNNVLNTLYSIISLGVAPNHDILSEVDPPESLFRLKIAAVLLDTCGQYFTSATSKKRLDYFLVFFQQYYWFKKSNATFTLHAANDLFPILTDNMYKECVHNVRPKLKLFKSYEAAQEAVEKLRNQLYPDLLKLMAADAGDDALTTIREENGGGEEESEAAAETEENTSEAVYESDDDGKPRVKRDDEEDENELDDLREISPTENEARVPEKTQEDLDFEQAFEKLATESYQERMKEAVKPNANMDIPVPMTVKTSGKKTYDQLQDKTTPPDATSAVPFVLMCRGSGKGGKQQFKTFQAPIDSQLAVNLKLQEQKIREENENVKRLTLNITERFEEEAYQESLLSQRTEAINRPRPPKQPKFKHQKGECWGGQGKSFRANFRFLFSGVPDADLIFN